MARRQSEWWKKSPTGPPVTKNRPAPVTSPAQSGPGGMFRQLGGQYFLFAIAAALSAVSPLLTIPALTSRFGGSGWTSVAIGQSVGTAAAVIIAYGWPLSGPPMIAAASRSDRSAILLGAIRSQVRVLFVVLPGAVVCTLLLEPHYPGAAALTAASCVVAGLAPTWYYVGQRKAQANLLTITAPTVTGAVVGACSLLLGAALWVLPAVSLVFGSATLLVILAREVGSSSLRLTHNPRPLRLFSSAQAPFALTQISSMVYINLPVALYAVASQSGLEEFSAADRLYRLALAAVIPITQVFQGWVPMVSQPERENRMVIALRTHFILGLAAAIALGGSMQVLASLLFRTLPNIPVSLCALYAVTLFVVMQTRCIGANVLAVRGLRGRLLLSAGTASVFAVIAIPLAAAASGAVAAATVVMATELIILVIQAWPIIPWLRVMWPPNAAARKVKWLC